MGDHSSTRKHVLDLPLEVKADGEPGAFEGYGAIFGNLDRDGDIVAKGAFADSLKERLPVLLWQHDATQPIGRFDEVREDEKGLYVRGRLSLQGRGREAYDLLKMGALDGLSIGFVTKEASKNALTGARTIRRAALMEISLVTFPANELARVSSVKAEGALPETKEAFIRMLTDHGMTADRAEAIAAKGLRRPRTGQCTDVALMLRERKNRLRTLVDNNDCISWEQKNATRQTVRLMPGARRTGVLLKPRRSDGNLFFPGLPKGRTLFQVKPPHRHAYFDCGITYWAWNGKRYEQRSVTLFQNSSKALTRLEMSTPSEDPFNPFDPSDWRTAWGRLAGRRTIDFNLIYHREAEPRGAARLMDGNPRVEGVFELVVS